MRTCFLIICLLLAARSAVADEFDLLELSLEDLLELEVSLVSRRQERWFDAPAAAHVLTGEDLAGFYNEYEDLRTGTLEAPYRGDLPGDPYLVAPVGAANLVRATTYGLELSADWQGSGDVWRLRAAYSYLRMDVETGPESNPLATVQEEEYPAHQLALWSAADLRDDLELDAMLRFVDELPGPGIPGYLALDLRLAWRIGSAFELALVGRNLLEAQHPEFKAELLVDTVPTETQRGVYGMVTWGFGEVR